MKFTKLVAASLLALASVPAAAQEAETAVTVGATVFDPQGGEVGTIAGVGEGYVIVDTGTNKATLPSNAVAANPDGLLMGMTKAELDAAVEKAEAEAEAALTAALVPGAQVFGISGTPAGTIKEVDPNGNYVVSHTLGDIALPKDQFTTIDQGLALKFTAAQLEAVLQERAAALAAVDAAIAPGAALITSDGVSVGTIREKDEAGNAVIDMESGRAFALPSDQFMLTEDGKLALRFTDAALKQALGL